MCNREWIHSEMYINSYETHGNVWKKRTWCINIYCTILTSFHKFLCTLQVFCLHEICRLYMIPSCILGHQCIFFSNIKKGVTSAWSNSIFVFKYKFGNFIRTPLFREMRIWNAWAFEFGIILILMFYKFSLQTQIQIYFIFNWSLIKMEPCVINRLWVRMIHSWWVCHVFLHVSLVTQRSRI